jgi:hypothetical protein
VSGSVEPRPDHVPPRRDFVPMALIVEDDDDVRASIADVARDGGYLVSRRGTATRHCAP